LTQAPRSSAHHRREHPCWQGSDRELHKGRGGGNDKNAACREIGKRRDEDFMFEPGGGLRHNQHPDGHHQNILNRPSVTHRGRQTLVPRYAPRSVRRRTQRGRQAAVPAYGNRLALCRNRARLTSRESEGHVARIP
jgi:hypothetical protein